jgi:death on curing protein
MFERLGLVDLLLIAEAVLDRPAEELIRVIDISSAELALGAPFAAFHGFDFYPDPVQRAAICCSRIIRNRPLPEGNARVAYTCMREMLDRGGYPWPEPSRGGALEISGALERLAAGTLSEAEFVDWVRSRVAAGQQLQGQRESGG